MNDANASSARSDETDGQEMTRRGVLGLPALAALGASSLIAGMAQAATSLAPGKPEPRVFRLYDGDDGKTHIEQVPFVPRKADVRSDLNYTIVPGNKVPEASYETLDIFYRKNVDVSMTARGPSADKGVFHHAQKPAIIFIASGDYVFESTDGHIQHLRAGDWLLSQDYRGTGGGHRTQVIGSEWVVILLFEGIEEL